VRPAPSTCRARACWTCWSRRAPDHADAGTSPPSFATPEVLLSPLDARSEHDADALTRRLRGVLAPDRDRYPSASGTAGHGEFCKAAEDDRDVSATPAFVLRPAVACRTTPHEPKAATRLRRRATRGPGIGRARTDLPASPSVLIGAPLAATQDERSQYRQQQDGRRQKRRGVCPAWTGRLALAARLQILFGARTRACRAAGFGRHARRAASCAEQVVLRAADDVGRLP